MKFLLKKTDNYGSVILGALFFRLMLESAYVIFVVPNFSYAGFELTLDLLKYVESWLIYLFFLYLFPKKFERPSNFFCAALLFIKILPLLVFYCFSDASREHLYVIASGAALIYILSRGRRLKLPFVKNGKNGVIFILWVGVMAVTFGFFKLGGYQLLNFNFLKVYEFRQASSEIFGGGSFAYLSNWAPKVFGPMLIAIYLFKKKYFTVFSIVVLHILWFGLSSHKGIALYPIMVVGVWFIYRVSGMTSILAISLALIVSFSLAAFIVFDDKIFGSMLIRRLFFVPSFLSFVYLDFFSQNQFVYWSNSLLSGFLSYPYEERPPVLISSFVGGDGYANNGLFASGYMHAGMLGVVFYAVVTGILFRLIDSLACDNVPPWFLSCVFSVPVFTLLVSSDLPTTLLTHGLGIAAILVFVYRRFNVSLAVT